MFKTPLAVFVVLALAAPALAGPPLPLDQALEVMARPGSWVEAAGDLQPDGVLLIKEAEIYSAADTSQTEDMAIYGTATRVDVAGGSMRVLGYVVTFDSTTTLKDDNKAPIDISRISEGLGVKVQGTVQANGTFVATKIKLQGTKPGKAKVKEKVFGPVTVLDAHDRSLRVLSTRAKLRPDATVWEVPVE